MTTDAKQPTCARCAAVLPWADVDRNVGACRACGAPFDFTIRSPLGRVVSPPPAASDGPLPPVELPLPLNVPSRPAGMVVKLADPTHASGGAYRGNARPATDFEVSWRHHPSGPIFLGGVIVGDVLFAVLVALVREGPAALFLLPLLAFFPVVFTLAALNSLRLRTQVVATHSTIFVRQRTGWTGSSVRTQSLPFGDATRFYVEQTNKVTGQVTVNDETTPIRSIAHDVCATRRDGGRVPLVVDIAREDVALYVAALLQERLDVPRLPDGELPIEIRDREDSRVALGVEIGTR